MTMVLTESGRSELAACLRLMADKVSRGEDIKEDTRLFNEWVADCERPSDRAEKGNAYYYLAYDDTETAVPQVKVETTIEEDCCDDTDCYDGGNYFLRYEDAVEKCDKINDTIRKILRE